MTSQLVNTTEEIIALLLSLPPQQQQQVVDFIEFLGQKYVQQQSNQSQPKPRIAGLHKGKGWMSEDFNCSSNS